LLLRLAFRKNRCRNGQVPSPAGVPRKKEPDSSTKNSYERPAENKIVTWLPLPKFLWDPQGPRMTEAVVYSMQCYSADCGGGFGGQVQLYIAAFDLAIKPSRSSP